MTPSSIKGANAYRSVGLQTQAPQHDQYQLVVMMFDAVLESVNRARGAMDQADTATKVEQITKAIRIIQEGLRTSLDLENGGELAANLANLYDYCVMRLTQANAANDTGMLAEVAELIKPLAEAWRQMRQGSPAAANDSHAATGGPAPNAPTAPPVTRRMNQMYGMAMA